MDALVRDFAPKDDAAVIVADEDGPDHDNEDNVSGNASSADEGDQDGTRGSTSS